MIESLDILKLEKATDLSFCHPLSNIPIYSCYVAAGFPSPADDYIEGGIDLNQCLIKHPASTFLFKVEGEAMIEAGIFARSTLIVDRSLEARNGKIVVAEYNGQFVVRRYYKDAGIIRLLSENKNYPALINNEASPILIWGVVTSIITEV